MLGLALVLALTCLAGFASLAIARRVAQPGADGALATCILTCTLILVPVHVLGVGNVLTRSSLGWTSLVLSSSTIVVSKGRDSLPTHLRATLGFFGSTLARFASLLFRDVRRAGLVAWAGALALAFAFVFTITLTWILPSDSWDGVWYHDLMVGSAIQAHGYAEIAMPGAGPYSLMQQANGYPRNGEMLGLWWVIFSGRRLLELPSVLANVPMAFATYALCRRYACAIGPLAPGTRRWGKALDRPELWRASAFLAAVAVVTIPGVRLEMRSTYIDGIFSAFCISALYFGSDPQLDAKRSVLASLALGLAFGAKGLALLFVPPLAVLTIAIVARREGLRGWYRTFAALAFGVFAIVVFGGFIYGLNWMRYGNPFHPISMQVGPWTFQGLVDFSVVDANEIQSVGTDLFALPTIGHEHPDIRRGAYGLVTGFVLLPVGAVALLVLVTSTFRQLVRCILQRRIVPELGPRFILLLTAGIVFLTLWKSPAIWSARYNMLAIAFSFALVQWLARTMRTPALVAHVAAIGFATNCMMWSWATPGWWSKGPDGFKQLLVQPRSRDAGSPSFVNGPTALAREKELRAGDVVVWSDDSYFVAMLWNDAYSNRLVYVPPAPPEQFVESARELSAKWISLSTRSPAVTYLRAHPEDWQEVGPVHNYSEHLMVVFRRSR